LAGLIVFFCFWGQLFFTRHIDDLSVVKRLMLSDYLMTVLQESQGINTGIFFYMVLVLLYFTSAVLTLRAYNLYALKAGIPYIICLVMFLVAIPAMARYFLGPPAEKINIIEVDLSDNKSIDEYFYVNKRDIFNYSRESMVYMQVGIDDKNRGYPELRRKAKVFGSDGVIVYKKQGASNALTGSLFFYRQ